MEITITQETKENGSHYIEATCGKTSAFVGRGASGYITVCCMNASHRAWRGAGRTFFTVDAAIKSYKKAEMKAIIGLLS